MTALTGSTLAGMEQWDREAAGTEWECREVGGDEVLELSAWLGSQPQAKNDKHSGKSALL